MKSIYIFKKLLFLIAVLLFSGTVSAQLTGTKNVPGDYATLADAITDLNTQGVGAGGVTINLVAANPQTAPAGGYVIGGAGTAILTTTDATKQVILQGNGNVITAPTPQTSGNLNDAIFKIIGADYITIDNFMMYENAANTTTTAGTNNMTEFGVALFYVTTTDGAQNCTIKNCTIDLDRTYQNTFGIYSNSTHTAAAVTTSATATTGNNNGLTIIANTITDVNNGIVVVGPTAAADHADGVTIGGTLANANNITNFGTTGTFSSYANVSGSVNGILARNTKNINISFNTIESSNGGVTAGTVNGIQIPAFSNAPTGTFTTNISNNNISVKSGLIAGAINGINVLGTGASATSTININSNNFNNCGHTVAGTGAITFITSASVHQFNNINSNTFTNISVNTTGNVTFISNSITLTATGAQNINGNAIVTGFNKTGAGGTIALITSAASSVAGAVVNWNNNNFSNITVTGATVIGGISNTDGGAPAKTIQGNTLSNWTGGSGAITALTVSFSGSSNVSNNTISNIIGTGGITGISTSSGTDAFSQNTIHTLTTTGAAVVTGIAVSGGTTKNIFRNQIYNLEANNAGGSANGILISGGTTVNAYNNFISDLKTPAANAANPLVGISVTGGTTVGLYYNTVYLNATSSGAMFGSSGISASTTPTLDLRNNIVVNTSTPAGATGFTSAYRRSSTTLTSYANTSNANAFYAGTPGANNLIFYDGTNSDQTIEAFKTRVTPRDAASFAENVPFINSTVAPFNLHLRTDVATQCESGGVAITTPIAITNDFDGDVRNVATPDIGADEGSFIMLDLTAPSITFSPLANTASTVGRTLAVTITDVSGVGSGANQPVLYWRIGAGAYTGPVAPTSIVGSVYTFSFGSGVVAGDVVNYFVVAQDVPGNVASSPAGATVTANPPLASAGPATPSSYSILFTLCGDKTVGTGGDYATLTAAIADINSKELCGPLTLTLTDALYSTGETFPLIINPNSGSSAVNVITIKPTLAGTEITGSVASAPLIRIRANFVTINGAVSGTNRDLTITNTSATSPNVIVISSTGTAPVTNVSVINSILVNGVNSSSAVVISDATPGTAGYFSNITIQNNSIQKALIGVFANAVVAAGNGANTLISGNDLNTSGVNAIRNVGIYVQGVDGATVSSNIIGNFEAATAESDRGIWLAAGTINSTVTGNTISNMNLTITGALGPVGILVSSGATSVNITVANNTITNSTSIATGTHAGIFLSTVNGVSVTGNTISNFTKNTNAGGLWGIVAAAATASNITENQITSLTNNTGSNVMGINIQGASVGVNVLRNKLSNISGTSTAGWGAQGILLSSTSTTANITAANNLIYDVKSYGYNGSGVSDNGYGIALSSGGGYNLYFNTVVLNTNQVTASGITAAINITSGLTTPNSVDIRNNIFVNSQTTGTRYAIYSGAAATVYSSINNNNYYSVSPTLGYLASDRADLVAWQTATGKDVNSISVVPPFVSGSDFKLTNCSHSLGAPIAGITTDLDGLARSATDPTIGAYEFVVVPNAPTAVFNPLTGATGVPVSGSATITFSQDVRKLNNAPITSTDLGLVTFKKVSDMSDVPFTLAYSNKVLTITPSASLAGETQYTISVSGIENECNEVLSGPNNTTFTTGSDDVTAPLYVSSSVTSATPNKVVLVFNENVTATNANGFTVTVNGAGVAITEAAALATNITLTIATPVVKGDVVTLEYNAATGTVTDIALNPLASFGPVSVTNNVLSPAKDIVTFGFTMANNPLLTADYNGVIGANTVSVAMPFGTDVTTLVASFTTSPDVQSVMVGAVAQVSGTTINNFTSAVSYIVTAEDGTTKTYVVTVAIYYPVPYTQGFNGSAAGWTVFNAGAGNSWSLTTTNPYSGTGALAYVYNSTNAANAWAFSPGIELVAGQTYVIQFWQRVHSATYAERMKLTIGKGNNVAAQTTVLWDNNNLTNTTYALRSVTYTATESGLFNVAFHCYSAADMWTLYIDDLLVREASNNANLSSLSSNAGVLSPEFNPATTEYEVNLLSNQETVPAVSAVKSDVNAAMVINQATGLVGNAALRTATVNVTAENGVTTKTYSVLFSKPVFNVTPMANDFGTVITGSASAEQVFTITNTGNIGLNIQSIALAGANALEFTLTDANSYPATVTDGELTVNVAFTPTTAGAKVATLVITEVGNATPYTVNLTGTAQLPTYTVTFSVVGINGSIGATVDDGAVTSPVSVEQGKDVVFTATPDAGYKVKEWTINGAVVAGNTSNTFVLSNLQSGANVTVEFEIILHDVNFSVVGNNGTINATVDGLDIVSPASVEQGKDVVFTATPETGYKVKEWTLNGAVVAGNTSNTYILANLLATANVTVEFEAIVYTITYFADGGTHTNPVDFVVTDLPFVLTDASKEGYTFEGWFDNAQFTGDVVTQIATIGNKSLYAKFELIPVPTYTVTFNVVDADSNPITDAVVTFDGTAAPAGSYVFANLLPGTYSYSVGKDGYVAVTGDVPVTDADVTVPITLNLVGVNTNTFANFSAYPNPFSKQISISNPSVVNRIVVANLIGQVVMDIRTNGAASIETASLPAGVYLVTFEAANGERLVRKMVKK